MTISNPSTFDDENAAPLWRGSAVHVSSDPRPCCICGESPTEVVQTLRDGAREDEIPFCFGCAIATAASSGSLSDLLVSICERAQADQAVTEVLSLLGLGSHQQQTEKTSLNHVGEWWEAADDETLLCQLCEGARSSVVERNSAGELAGGFCLRCAIAMVELAASTFLAAVERAPMDRVEAERNRQEANRKRWGFAALDLSALGIVTYGPEDAI